MDRQVRTGDTVLVKSREMTGRIQTLSWWLRGGGVKTTENKIRLPRWSQPIKGTKIGADWWFLPHYPPSALTMHCCYRRGHLNKKASMKIKLEDTLKMYFKEMCAKKRGGSRQDLDSDPVGSKKFCQVWIRIWAEPRLFPWSNPGVFSWESVPDPQSYPGEEFYQVRSRLFALKRFLPFPIKTKKKFSSKRPPIFIAKKWFIKEWQIVLEFCLKSFDSGDLNYRARNSTIYWRRPSFRSDTDILPPFTRTVNSEYPDLETG